jgi:hypothetical protein
MRRSIFGTFVSLTLILGLAWSTMANAVPSFARKYELNCSGCHTAYPQLNATGRKFKEAGYRFPSDSDKKVALEISDALNLDKHVPISAVLVARPYDKKDSGNTKNRALHEVEIIVAGTIANNWSGYFEIEAEDENDFEPEVAPAVLSYNLRKEINFQASWAPVFWADSYGILNDHFRLTRGHVGAIDQGFGGADDGGKLRSNRQNVGIFGRVLSERVFYNANWSGDADDAEGEDARTYSGLVNVDITGNIMVGGFGMAGDSRMMPGDPRLDYSRYGVQSQVDIGDARLQGIFVTASDDQAGGGEHDNDTYSLQAFWTFHDDSLRPTFVPLVRFDSFETNDGNDDFKDLTLNVTYYITQNIKGFVEYWDRFDAPTDAQEDDRLTLQFVAAF